MNLRRIFFVLLIFSVFISFSIVSASELDFSLEDSQTSIDDSTIGVIDDSSNQLDDISLEEEIVSENDESEGNSHIIYVGKNLTADGNGSKENPYNNLELVQSNYGETSDKIIINMFEGTYFIGSELTFKTNDFKINSVNGTVILKNVYNENNKKQDIYLTTSGANFTMSNITFDKSDFTIKAGKNQDFIPFRGNGYSNVIYEDCVFIGINVLTEYNDKNNNILFERCSFISSQKDKYLYYSANSNITFRYCKFLAEFNNGIAGGSKENSVIYDSNWFGQNSITKTYFYGAESTSPRYTNFNSYSFTRYAILKVSESYLGDNKYEIFGQLMWNDSTTDNIDQLGPMTVYLSADSGDIPETVIMKNGTFKVTYVAQSDNHKINISLDNQNITINNNVTFTLDSPIINYGDKQNITVTFKDNVNGTVYVVVNNKTYYKYCDNQNNITIDIDDVLSKGIYDVSVNFVSDKILYRPTELNALGNEIPNYKLFGEIDNIGFNNTKLTVNGLTDYTFDFTVTPNSLYIGDNATIKLSLPDGATGNVTVKVGDNEAKTFNVNDIISIDGFIAGGNVVSITYNGNDVYDSKGVVKNIFALNKPTISIPEIDAGKATTTTITLPQNATGNVTVTVDGNVISVVNLTNGSATVTIPELSAGKHNVTISYSGDDNYAGFAQTSAVEVKEPAKPTPKPDDQKPATFKKTATKITAKKKTFKAKKKVKKYTITLKAGKKPVKKVQVILKIGKKTYKAKTNAKGKATFKIKKLIKKGKYTAKITFKGNKLYKASSKKVKITVKK